MQLAVGEAWPLSWKDSPRSSPHKIVLAARVETTARLESLFKADV
jgi:hypothetical protein